MYSVFEFRDSDLRNSGLAKDRGWQIRDAIKQKPSAGRHILWFSSAKLAVRHEVEKNILFWHFYRTSFRFLKAHNLRCDGTKTSLCVCLEMRLLFLECLILLIEIVYVLSLHRSIESIMKRKLKRLIFFIRIRLNSKRFGDKFTIFILWGQNIECVRANKAKWNNMHNSRCIIKNERVWLNVIKHRVFAC